jgi:hypothetical protein
MCHDPYYDPPAGTLLPWLDTWGRDPSGTPRFNTEWTLMGSWYDTYVPWESGTGHPYIRCDEARPRGCDWFRTPEHWVR